MRFKALLYKELRECLPFAIGAAILFMICGFTAIQTIIKFDNSFIVFSEDSENNFWNLFKSSFIQPACPFLALFAAALGFSLGIRQYAAESFFRTWGFLLHRSINRGRFLSAKLLAAILSFIPLAVIWCFFYIYGHDKQYFPIPPTEKILFEGLIFTALGFVAYLAVAMAALNKAKWYTTKIISIAFGIWMFVSLLMQWQIWLGWLTLICASAILLIQITDNFLNREFE